MAGNPRKEGLRLGLKGLKSGAANCIQLSLHCVWPALFSIFIRKLSDSFQWVWWPRNISAIVLWLLSLGLGNSQISPPMSEFLEIEGE